MSECSAEMHIISIRARLIGLQSPAARTFSKKLINHWIITINDSKLLLLGTHLTISILDTLKSKF